MTDLLMLLDQCNWTSAKLTLLKSKVEEMIVEAVIREYRQYFLKKDTLHKFSILIDNSIFSLNDLQDLKVQINNYLFIFNSAYDGGLVVKDLDRKRGWTFKGNADNYTLARYSSNCVSTPGNNKISIQPSNPDVMMLDYALFIWRQQPDRQITKS